MEIVNYYGDWRDQRWACKHCGWKGQGVDLSDGDVYTELMEMDCPGCHTGLLIVNFPTISESKANWDKVSAADKAQIESIEALDRAFDEGSLKDPSQLPDLPGKSLVLQWDCNTHGPEFPGVGPGGWQTVIRHGEVEVWREPAYYECYPRFIEIVDILLLKYGARLHDLVPTNTSGHYLYGDRLSAPREVDQVRARLQAGRPGSAN